MFKIGLIFYFKTEKYCCVKNYIVTLFTKGCFQKGRKMNMLAATLRVVVFSLIGCASSYAAQGEDLRFAKELGQKEEMLKSTEKLLSKLLYLFYKRNVKPSMFAHTFPEPEELAFLNLRTTHQEYAKRVTDYVIEIELLVQKLESSYMFLRKTYDKTIKKSSKYKGNEEAAFISQEGPVEIDAERLFFQLDVETRNDVNKKIIGTYKAIAALEKRVDEFSAAMKDEELSLWIKIKENLATHEYVI